MEKNIFYDDFVSTIENILKKKKIENKLLPYNFKEDKKIIHNFFLKPILNLNNNNLSLNWEDEKWIESMKYIRLGLLSFLYKNNATLYKIYTLVENDPLDSHILLEKYKNLINNFLTIEKMSKANKFLLNETLVLDELQSKNYYLFLNIKNITDPKYISYIFDLLSHQEYRKTLLKYIIDGTEKIDLKKIIEIKETSSYEFIEDFLKNLEKNNIYNKIIKFILCLNLKGEVLIKKEIYIKMQNYVKTVISESSVLTKFLDNLQKEYKNSPSPTKFKNEIKIIYLPNHLSFTNKKNMNKNDLNSYKDFYNNKTHVNLYNIDYDKHYREIFVENKEFSFSKNDIIQRINNIFCLLLEYITVNYFDSKEEKINTINNLFSNHELFKKFNIDLDNKNELAEVLKNIKENGLVKNDETTQESYENKEVLKELIEKIKETLKNNEDTNYFYNTLVEFLFIIKNLDIVDISNIPKEDFNICFDLVKKLTQDPNKLKTFIFHLIEKENFSFLLTFFEKKNIFKINKILKEKMVELFLKTILEISNLLKLDNEEKTKSFVKFLYILAKTADHIIYYMKKIKQSNNKIEKKAVKKQVIFR